MRDSFDRIKEILLGDLGSVERVSIALGFALIIVLVSVFLSKWARDLTKRRITRRTSDPLLADFIGSFIRILVLLFGLTVLFRFLGLSAAVGGLLAGAGITAFVIGFALRDIGENFLAGILLAFKRPFRVGDIVEINGIRGKVLALNLRDIQLKTRDGKDVFIPNANIIKSPLFNFTIDGFLAFSFELNIPIAADISIVKGLIMNALNDIPGILQKERRAEVQVTDMVGNQYKLSVTYWVNTDNPDQTHPAVRSNAIQAVVKKLQEHQIL
ncbi:MAG: mechanosensitive ion channel [Lunatimonas sp.]|nr:mechanosensitive ion channel [Lunatimonas sp.]